MKREGCAACHQTLEPLSSYFARWVENDWSFLDPKRYPVQNPACKQVSGNIPANCTGRYDNVFSTPTAGMLRGAYGSPDNADAMAQGLGDYLVGRADFAPCGAEHGGKFLGRSLGAEDSQLRDALDTDAGRRKVSAQTAGESTAYITAVSRRQQPKLDRVATRRQAMKTNKRHLKSSYLACLRCRFAKMRSRFLQGQTIEQLPGHGQLAQDTTHKETPRLVPAEAYIQNVPDAVWWTYLALQAQAQLQAGGGALFDSWTAYLGALGLPNYATDLSRNTQTNALMVASFERLGVALCDKAVEKT